MKKDATMMANQIAAATLTGTTLVFCLTLAYHLGRQSMRIEKLEEWRTEVRKDLTDWRDEMKASIDHLGALIRRES